LGDRCPPRSALSSPRPPVRVNRVLLVSPRPAPGTPAESSARSLRYSTLSGGANGHSPGPPSSRSHSQSARSAPGSDDDDADYRNGNGDGDDDGGAGGEDDELDFDVSGSEDSHDGGGDRRQAAAALRPRTASIVKPIMGSQRSLRGGGGGAAAPAARGRGRGSAVGGRLGGASASASPTAARGGPLRRPISRNTVAEVPVLKGSVGACSCAQVTTASELGRPRPPRTLGARVVCMTDSGAFPCFPLPPPSPTTPCL
jgi:hypothetical protein